MILNRGKKRQPRADIQFISNHLLKITLVLLMLASILFLVSYFKKVTYFPIEGVSIVGAQHADHEKIQHLISPLVNRGFFSVETVEIKDRLLQLPWVAHVVVQRIWPKQIFIQLTEKQAAARWNNSTLLSIQGELFQPPQADFPSDLPSFAGPDGQQIEMLSYYNKINKLLEPLHLKISRLEFSPFSLWKMTFDNGIKLTVGHKDFLTRLEHFVKLYPKIVGDRAEEVEYIDLRYSNGMSVKWKTVT